MTQARLNSLSILNFLWQTVQVDVADVENDFGSKKTIDQKILEVFFIWLDNIEMKMHKFKFVVFEKVD